VDCGWCNGTSTTRHADPYAEVLGSTERKPNHNGNATVVKPFRGMNEQAHVVDAHELQVICLSPASGSPLQGLGNNFEGD